MLSLKSINTLKETTQRKHKQGQLNQKKQKTTIRHPTERKKLCEKKWQRIIQNCCYLENLTLIPEEILDKQLLFDLKKTSEEKIFDSILEKIPDKNDNYYIEHREGTNAFRIRKDPKQAKEDELKTMLETVDKGIKRATSKSKLSELKRIEKQLIKQYEDLGEELLTMNELKKLFKSLQTDAKTVLFTEENINDKLLKKIKKVEI